MNNFVSRMQAVQSPIIPVVGELIRQHPGTISLGQGVVSYPPPKSATEFLSNFLADSGNNLYQAVEGIPTLIKAISQKLEIFNHIKINDRNCVVVTAGSNMAFMNAVLAITSIGDEIILNTPYYFNHEMAIEMLGCRAVLVNTDENYQLRIDAILAAITPKTRAIVTISPNNPTGVIYPEAVLREVNQICRERGIYHISDEAYEYFTYDGVQHVSPGSFPDAEEHTISLYSLSKAYGFASWRIGYMVIPQHLLTAVKKVQDTNLICPPVISQYAAFGALQAETTEPKYIVNHVNAIAQVRKSVINFLNQLQEVCTITPANGAFYFFLKVHTQMDSLTLVERLIRDYRIAVIPGTTFGMKDGCYLRVAYGALQQNTVEQGMQRLVKGLQEIMINH
ncbi:pyridoxal phosphate-dependent aminotransferase [Calothrix sp. PCC 6303]|uniref:pyridoxal phosphate-dependent aminotransferase n=1 Tax=Calothrix sp. PCC 6303 TaxID=1170562 RepID=UPI0002A02123|nr:pyridoxal phosphate-dependent aminotransferase [Calothrix sp. PCC 6303]AFZ01004.1 Aspartate transaminase [Calothrix sp. PCC 6303]